MKLLFVVNPISGGVNKDPFLQNAKSICDKYGIVYQIFKTTGKNDDIKIRDVLLKFAPDRVASIGGDGTTLFTAIALINSSIPMGIIPLGSANGMATELFVNPNPEEALKDLIVSEIIAGLDVVIVNDKYYSIHIGDVGVNSQLVEEYTKDKKRGMVTYAKYFIDSLRKSKAFECTINANGKTYHEKSLMVAICNSRKYGSGVVINYEGNPMDGKFEIVMLKDINLDDLIRAGLTTINKRFVNKKK
jgi:diacylglycerol kinase family enzyme